MTIIIFFLLYELLRVEEGKRGLQASERQMRPKKKRWGLNFSYFCSVKTLCCFYRVLREQSSSGSRRYG